MSPFAVDNPHDSTPLSPFFSDESTELSPRLFATVAMKIESSLRHTGALKKSPRRSHHMVPIAIHKGVCVDRDAKANAMAEETSQAQTLRLLINDRNRLG